MTLGSGNGRPESQGDASGGRPAARASAPVRCLTGGTAPSSSLTPCTISSMAAASGSLTLGSSGMARCHLLEKAGGYVDGLVRGEDPSMPSVGEDPVDEPLEVADRQVRLELSVVQAAQRQPV